MGIFNKIRKALRKGKALPNEFGPLYSFKAKAEEKPATIPSEYAKTVVKKQAAASKTKPTKDAENKKAPAKKPAEKTPAKKAPAKAPAKAQAKKPAPKKKK